MTTGMRNVQVRAIHGDREQPWLRRGSTVGRAATGCGAQPGGMECSGTRQWRRSHIKNVPNCPL